ncbi:MAG: hypothetical protein PHG96_02355 [Kiritimatiellae bacterium]|nr:hypothetical protein [Kiritimatiellia bacterium]MDD4024698.1 hypothetical protein [Kiritimatiellia bacterium]MDD4622184.1 hypothetical protein [Kiritimatiellia bacterium]
MGNATSGIHWTICRWAVYCVLAGLENLSSAAVTGEDLPENVGIRVVDGAIYAYFPTGTTILFK